MAKKFYEYRTTVYKPESEFYGPVPYAETEKAIGIDYLNRVGEWITHSDTYKRLWIAKSLVSITFNDINKDCWELVVRIPAWVLASKKIDPSRIEIGSKYTIITE